MKDGHLLGDLAHEGHVVFDHNHAGCFSHLMNLLSHLLDLVVGQSACGFVKQQ